jgi:hypothetical protein
VYQWRLSARTKPNTTATGHGCIDNNTDILLGGKRPFGRARLGGQKILQFILRRYNAIK